MHVCVALVHLWSEFVLFADQKSNQPKECFLVDKLNNLSWVDYYFKNVGMITYTI